MGHTILEKEIALCDGAADNSASQPAQDVLPAWGGLDPDRKINFFRSLADRLRAVDAALP